MRIVIDCNVFVSAALGSATCQAVLREAFLNHEVFYSKAISKEIEATFEKVKLSAIRHKQQAIIETLNTLGIKVHLEHPAAFSLPDPDDAIYLQTAVVSFSTAIVTGNKKHFPKSTCGKIQVLSPREFLDHMKIEQPSSLLGR